jgi:RepB DNA-primase from phage plasmid
MSNNVSKLTDSVKGEGVDSKQQTPNRGAETREYFKLLDPENPEAFTLQVFDDNEQRKDITLAATLHGSLDKLQPLKGRFTTLKEANLAGCGIYCTVNETNGKGREASDIVRFRAVWVDDDNKDGKSASRTWPIEPTFVVQTSPGKFQAYWCVTDKWLADEQGRVEFNGVIERLVAKHHCDKGAKGINRVLRVPGSLHLKNPNKPFIVRLIKRDGPRYTREQILAAFPPLLQSAETSKKNSVGTVTSEWNDLITNVITGENYHDTLTVLAAKMLRSGMNAGAVVNLLRALMESSEGPHDDRWKARYLEIQRAVSSAEKKGIAAVPEKNLKHTVEDFVAYRPSGNFIFIPTRDMWPANSVNASVWPVDVEGKEKPVPAASWIAAHRAVEQMTWAPGEPMEIHDKLIAEGGWIKHPGCTVFNLYRPPVIVAKAGSVDLWLNHLRCLYPDEAEHILCWLAHRVQKPQEKINHGLVFGGAHGIGKDSLLEAVKHAVGSWNFLEANPKQIMGRFTRS